MTALRAAITSARKDAGFEDWFEMRKFENLIFVFESYSIFLRYELKLINPIFNR